MSRTASAVGDAYFQVLAGTLVEVMELDAAFIVERERHAPDVLRPLAVVLGGQAYEIKRHDLSSSVAQRALGGDAALIVSGAREAFPGDPLVTETSAEGYLAIALRASDGAPIGFVGVAAQTRLPDPLTIEAILRLVAPRVGAEIERMQTNAELREQAETARAIMDGAHDLVLRTRPGTPPVVDYVNPAFERFTGYSPEDLVADPELLLRIAHPEYREKFAKMLVEGATDQPLVWRWVRRDGTTLWTEGRRRFIYDDDGNVVAIESIGRDITALKEAEEKAAQLERVERLLLEAVPDAVLRVDRTGTVLDSTYAEGKVAPFLVDASANAQLDELLPQSTAREVARRVGASLAGGMVETHRFGVQSEDDDLVFEVRVVPIDANEAVLMFRDMTGEDFLTRVNDRERAREEIEGKAERRILRRNPYDLTFREFTVLELVAGGMTDKQVAAQLGISLNTVGKHVSNVLAKMQVSSRTEASVHAVQEHLLD